MVESKHQWKAWLYLAPAIVLLLIFTVWPIINTVRIAFLEGYNALEAIYGVQFNFGIGKAELVQLRGGLEQGCAGGVDFGGVGRVLRRHGKAALAGYGHTVALGLQLVIGALDGIGIDGKLARKGAHGGEFLPARDAAGDDELAQTVAHLLVNWAGIAIVQNNHRQILLIGAGRGR